jgi:hypothetical protein
MTPRDIDQQSTFVARANISAAGNGASFVRRKIGPYLCCGGHPEGLRAVIYEFHIIYL